MGEAGPFAAHGFQIVRGLVSPARAAELGAALDALGEGQGALWEFTSPSRRSVPLAAHAHDRAIARLAASALGCPRLQLLQDGALIKPAARGGAVAWHQDYPYLGYLDRPRAVTLRLALDPCTIESGCLEVLDGSHLAPPRGALRPFAAPVVDGLGGEPLRERIVALELEPGDATLHHCLTFHRSGPNASARARRTLISRYFDAECRLMRERLPASAAALFPTVEGGRLDERAFPLLVP